jgi:hypothetical protein
MNQPEICLIIFACISCVCNGGENERTLTLLFNYFSMNFLFQGIQPAFGIILSKLIAVSD